MLRLTSKTPYNNNVRKAQIIDMKNITMQLKCNMKCSQNIMTMEKFLDWVFLIYSLILFFTLFFKK
jgi:hypothetical protein